MNDIIGPLRNSRSYTSRRYTLFVYSLEYQFRRAMLETNESVIVNRDLFRK